MFLLDSGLWGIRKETWKQKWKEWSPYLTGRRELYILSDNMLQRISRSDQTPCLSSPSQWWQLQVNTWEVSGFKRWHIGLESNVNEKDWKTRDIEWCLQVASRSVEFAWVQELVERESALRTHGWSENWQKKDVFIRSCAQIVFTRNCLYHVFIWADTRK